MKNRKILWIVVIVVVLGAAGAYFGLPLLNPVEDEPSDAPSVQTAVARRGDLVILASGTGEIIPADEIKIGFSTSGTLYELYVNVGDTVFAGQPIALLENNKSEASITSAIVSAQLSLIDSQDALASIFSDWDIEVAKALLSVEDAEDALVDLQDPTLQLALTLKAVVQAQDELENAQNRFYTTNLTASQANIDSAYATMILAEENLSKAQDSFDRVADKPETDLGRAQAQSKLSSAQQSYDTAVANYNAMTSTASDLEKQLAEAELTVAQARLSEAQAEYEAVLEGPSAGELAMAEAELKAAQAEYARLKDGPDPDEIVKAELKLEDAQAKLSIAEEDAVYIELVAPINGTIMKIDASVGESLGTQAFVILADLTQPLLEVYLDETDLDKIAVGYEVEVYFDAILDEIFTGVIVEVDPALQTISGLNAVKAIVQLSNFGKPQTLPVGLSAGVDVIGGKAENAVLIPVEALREVSDGMYGVFVMVDGEPKLTPVEVGLIDFTSAEIVSGINPGDVVTTGIVETE